MRAFILCITLIISLRVESVSICEFCECQQKSELLDLISVNCSFHENVLNNDIEMLNSSISLDLSRTNLTTIPANFLQSNTLGELFLNKNLIKEMNLDAYQLPELKRLDLSNNELEILNPELFKGITKLEYLNLANNKFTATSQLNFSLLVNLKEIILDNNDIGSDIAARNLFDQNGFGLSLKIENLSISGINLKDISSDYFKPVYYSLKKLIVSNNNLTTFLNIPRRIEYIDISNNPIRNITKDDFSTYDPLSYLRVLKLNNLKISEVPKNVFSTVILTSLELENNKNLKVFSNLTFGRQLVMDDYDFLIENLTLKGSNLRTIDASLSILFRHVKRLDLQQNPWVCDCHLAWVRKLSIDQDLTEDLRCMLPLYLHNRRIFDLDEKDFICLKSWWEGSQIGITIGLVLYTALVIVTLTWIYVFIYVPKPPINKQDYTQLH